MYTRLIKTKVVDVKEGYEGNSGKEGGKDEVTFSKAMSIQFLNGELFGRYLIAIKRIMVSIL